MVLPGRHLHSAPSLGLQPGWIYCTHVNAPVNPPLSCTFLHFPALSCAFLHFPTFSYTFVHFPTLSYTSLPFTTQTGLCVCLGLICQSAPDPRVIPRGYHRVKR